MNNCPVMLYTAPDGKTQLDVKLENETVWLSVNQMSILFDKEAYVYALDTLDHYDYQTLGIEKTTEGEAFRATYESAMEAINVLRDKFGGSALFAHEKDESFHSSIGQIYQTFDLHAIPLVSRQ